MTPRLCALGATLLLLACHTPTPAPERLALPAGTHGLLVAPLNLSIAPPRGFDADPQPVWDALIAHLSTWDRTLVPLAGPDAELMWHDALASGAERGTPDGLRDAWSQFARRVAEEEAYDALVLPTLLLRRARIAGHQAQWDGAMRSFDVPASLGGNGWEFSDPAQRLGFAGYRGELAAASLHVAVLAPDGRIVHEGIGGLALVQELDARASGRRQPWVFQAREAPFADAAELRRGVEVAFARPLASWHWKREAPAEASTVAASNEPAP